MNQTFKNIVSSLGLDFIFLHLVDFLKGSGKERAEKLIDSWLFGFGVNDEILFQSACSYAILQLKVNIAKINKIVAVIKEYSISERKRIVQILGNSEQEITIEAPATDEDGHVLVDKKNKTLLKTTKVFANVKGGQALAVLAEMSEQEIRDFFEVGGSLNTAGKQFKATGKIVSEKVKQAMSKIEDIIKSVAGIPETQSIFDFMADSSTEFRNSFHATLAKPTMFEKITDKLDFLKLRKKLGIKRRY